MSKTRQLKLTHTKRVHIHRYKGRYITKTKAKQLGIKGKYRQRTWHKGLIIKDVKWKPPTIKFMWRTTVAINYAWHRKYYSYKVNQYAKHKRDLKNRYQLTADVYAKFKEYRGYTVGDLQESGNQIRIGYEAPTKIKLEKRVVNTTEYQDEYLRKGR